jgi:hypothetical protein
MIEADYPALIIVSASETEFGTADFTDTADFHELS